MRLDDNLYGACTIAMHWHVHCSWVRERKNTGQDFICINHPIRSTWIIISSFLRSHNNNYSPISHKTNYDSEKKSLWKWLTVKKCTQSHAQYNCSINHIDIRDSPVAIQFVRTAKCSLMLWGSAQSLSLKRLSLKMDSLSPINT